MRIYKPQNELGQALLNEGQLVASSQKKTKTLQDGAITLTSSDVHNIGAWEVKNVMVTIAGTTMSFTPEVRRAGENIVIVFDDANSTKSLGFTEATIVLGLMEAQGFAGAEEEVQLTELEITILEAKESGDNSKIEEEITKTFENGQPTQFYTMGQKLATSGIEEYTLADVKNYDEFVTKATGQNMGSFSDTGKIGTIDGNNKMSLDNATFSYNLMSLKTAQKENDCISVFYNSNIEHFDSCLYSLTDASYMFNGSDIISFKGKMPYVKNMSYMFKECRRLESFEGSIESLTNADGMFESLCHNLTVVKLSNWGNEQNLSIFVNQLPYYPHADGRHKLCLNDMNLIGWLAAKVKEQGWVVCDMNGNVPVVSENGFYGYNLSADQIRTIMNDIPYGNGANITFHVADDLIRWDMAEDSCNTAPFDSTNTFIDYYYDKTGVFSQMQMKLNMNGYNRIYIMTERTQALMLTIPVLC